MTVAANSSATSEAILKGLQIGDRWLGDYVCPCGCEHVVTLEHQIKFRLSRQRVLHYKCGGHGLANFGRGIPGCGWETDFVVDDCHWHGDVRPDRCSRCNGSIYVTDVSEVTELHDVIVWDTWEVLNPGEKEIWNYALMNFKRVRDQRS